MVDQPIAHHPPVNVAILNFRQRRVVCSGSATGCRALGQIAMLPLNRQRMSGESGAAVSPAGARALAIPSDARYWRITCRYG